MVRVQEGTRHSRRQGSGMLEETGEITGGGAVRSGRQVGVARGAQAARKVAPAAC